MPKITGCTEVILRGKFIVLNDIKKLERSICLSNLPGAIKKHFKYTVKSNFQTLIIIASEREPFCFRETSVFSLSAKHLNKTSEL